MSDNNNNGYVKTTARGAVAEIEFYHPSHNSLPGNLLSELSRQILDAGKNPDFILILLKSAGDRTFCAGASFDELIAIEDGITGKKFFMGFANVINAIRTCGKLVIGRVQGKAVGGGVGLLSATDYCFATKFAAVRLSELAVGIGPFVIGPAVARKTGLSAFSTMALSPNQWQTAQYAKEKGLYAEIFQSTEDLDNHIEEIIKELSSYNPDALNQLKRVFWEGTENWNELLEKRATLSGQLILSEFSKETIAAFKNR